MSKKTPEALRQDRLKYIKGNTTPKAPAVAETNPVVAPVAAPAAVEATPAVITAPVADPATLTSASAFEFLLFNQGTKNPHWLVVANGDPVAKIQYADVSSIQHLSLPMFEDEKFGLSIAKAMKAEAPAKILSSLKARTYVATVQESDVFKQLKDQALTAADDDVRLARAELRNNMLNVLGLVLTAQSKNYLTSNELKAEFYEQMTAHGVSAATAAHIIEASWVAAQPYLDATIKQAMEWMDIHPEAYKQIERQIHGMDGRPVTVASSVGSETIPASTQGPDFLKMFGA